MNEKLDEIKFVGALILLIFLVIVVLSLATFAISYNEATRNAKTKIINITDFDIIIDEDDFYIIAPNGDKISLRLSGGEVLNLTKHSEILVKIKMYPAWGLYGGSDWFVDGVVKKP